jgi:zinc transport system substrate-binding protein
MPRTAALLAALVAALAGGVACGAEQRAGDGGGTRVVAGFFPLAEAARRVGDGRVEVVDLTPAGAEPHDLEITPDQAAAVEDARVVIVMGEGFQPALEEHARRRPRGTVTILDALGLARDAGATADPHVWLDPVRYGEIVDVVQRALTAAVPEGAPAFAANAGGYRAQIDAVHARYRAGLARCERKTIVTAHDAFGHLARRYGLEVEAIAGIAPDEEPGAGRIADLAEVARREGVTTIFTEELVPAGLAEALAREAGGLRVEVLDPLEGLSDAARARGDDWVAVMDANLVKLRTALGCA